MVEAAGFLPGAFRVASRAVVAQAALVLVIFLVAFNTFRRKFFAVEIAGMAALARHEAMLARQDVVRIGIVVELDALPVAGGMAGVATIAELRLVVVVLLVARDAGLGRVLVLTVLVAVVALDGVVLARERKAGLRVVELGVLPRGVGVAIGALRPERALVLVILAVARDAIARCDAIGPGGRAGGRDVALGAIDLDVRAVKGEVGRRMVEFLPVEPRDRELPALVLGVARLAGLRRHVAMQAASRPQVRADILVAIGAQPVLRIAVESDVAGLAVLFEFGVRLGQLSGRQDRLETTLGVRRRNPRGAGNGEQQGRHASPQTFQASL